MFFQSFIQLFAKIWADFFRIGWMTWFLFYLQDTHTSAWYVFIATSSAFGLLLDTLCLMLVAFVTFSFLFVTTGWIVFWLYIPFRLKFIVVVAIVPMFFVPIADILGDKVGLAITQTMTLTFMLQWGIRQSAEVANQLMSVERVLEYTQLPPEKV